MYHHGATQEKNRIYFCTQENKKERIFVILPWVLLPPLGSKIQDFTIIFISFFTTKITLNLIAQK